ncbi:porin [Rickettsiaceae bacterium]|nr:porin [Rickettsiaceae bacterium]
MRISKYTFFVSFFLSSCLNFNSFAADSEVKIGGAVEVQAVYYSSDGDDTQKKLSTYNKEYGFSSSGNFFLDYKLVADSGLKYGAKIGAEITARNNRSAPLIMYVESDFGKIEAGSGKSAMDIMKITGYTASCATGNGWDAFAIISPKDGKDKKVAYVTNFCNFLDAKSRTPGETEFPRKISYFTPKFGSDEHKFQIGVSYIPDTSNIGYESAGKGNLSGLADSPAYKFAITDGIGYGVSYEGKFSESLSAKLSFVGEIGKPLAFDKDDESKKADVKFKSLNTYNVGSEVTYDKISVAASYMNYNQSLTNSEIDKLGRNTNIYSLGAKYAFSDDVSVSLNHFYSEHKKNKVNASSVGGDYFVASGIKTYAQLTHYKAEGEFIENDLTKKDKSTGTVVILGMKVSL